MPVGDLRALVAATSRAAHGVSVTIVRPAPNQTPITTVGIWAPALNDETRVGQDFARREPRRVLAVPRTAVDEVPRGTLVTGPDERNAATATWRVDGLELVDADTWRLILVRVTS